ncbi:thiazole synthase [Cysteiniphilum litorale]|uniref:thiazole synthase n=1 Tax=Cysteiniphilum litorale TaxID=2056700 RepID=UPI003F882C6E
MEQLQLYDMSLNSRMLLGTALYPSLESMCDAINTSQTQMVTVALKRELHGGKNNFFWQSIQQSGCHVLPNTAGCKTADEALMIAKAARQIFNTDFIKLEVIGDNHTLQPNVFELVKAAEILIDQGFKVLPYCTDDLIVCQQLVNLGCKVIMPLGSYIGSGQGIVNPSAFKLLRSRLKDITLIVDAGIGTPSDAVLAMELGFDGVLLNSAVALAENPPLMADAFRLAIESGRKAYLAKRMPQRELAQASTPLQDTPFWHQIN